MMKRKSVTIKIYIKAWKEAVINKGDVYYGYVQ